jgi:hypothetical protein
VATPILERHTLRGALGDVLIDIRGAADRTPRPAVIVLQGFSGLEERLARAGFTVITLDAEQVTPNDLESVIAALDRSELGVPRPTSIGMVAQGAAAGTAILAAAGSPRIATLVTWSAVASVPVEAAAERVRVPWLRVIPAAGLESGLDATTGWLIRHLP